MLSNVCRGISIFFKKAETLEPIICQKIEQYKSSGDDIIFTFDPSDYVFSKDDFYQFVTLRKGLLDFPKVYEKQITQLQIMKSFIHSMSLNIPIKMSIESK